MVRWKKLAKAVWAALVFVGASGLVAVIAPVFAYLIITKDATGPRDASGLLGMVVAIAILTMTVCCFVIHLFVLSIRYGSSTNTHVRENME